MPRLALSSSNVSASASRAAPQWTMIASDSRPRPRMNASSRGSLAWSWRNRSCAVQTIAVPRAFTQRSSASVRVAFDRLVVAPRAMYGSVQWTWRTSGRPWVRTASSTGRTRRRLVASDRTLTPRSVRAPASERWYAFAAE